MFRRFLPAVAAWLSLSCTPIEPASEPSAPPSGPEMVAPGAPPPAEPGTIDMAPRSAGSLSVTVIPQHSLLADAEANLDVLIRLVGEGEAGPRPNLDLAIVLDRSGSMEGDKLVAVKQAAIELVEQLEARDDVSLVSYASDVTRHGNRRGANQIGQSFFRRELLAIHSGGSTALGPALFEGLTMLLEAEREDTTLTHLLLLSDGRANEGETDPQVLGRRARQAFERGISTSTLGVGLDYNEDLMTKIADAGGGRYHFIESPTEVSRVLDDELAGLAATVVRGIELHIDPQGGVRVVSVFGYANELDGARVTAPVGSLAAGQSRAILTRVHVPASPVGTLNLSKLRLRFVDAGTGEKKEMLIPLQVPVVATKQEVARSENLEVTVRAAEIEANEKLRAAALAVERREFEQARGTLRSAIQELQQQQAATESAELAGQLDELESALDDVDEAERDRTRYERSKKKMKSKVYQRAK